MKKVIEMDEKLSKGLTCLNCQSIVFSIEQLIEHIGKEPHHNWWKFAEKGCVHIKLLLDYKNAEKYWWKE